MLNEIIDTLEADERLSGWQLREIDRRSRQLYLNMEREESLRRVDALSYEIEILVNRKATRDGAKVWVTGNSRFSLDPATLNRLEQELELAHASAALVENEAYIMTEVGGLFPQVPLSDPVLVSEPEAALRVSADRLREAASKEDLIRFSAAEFFSDQTRLRYFNSQGVNVLQESTLFSGEFVLLAKGPKGESEVFKAFKARRVQDLDLGRLVREGSSSARKRTVAVLPKTGAFDVVFSGEALDHFFSWFCTQASAAAKYNRMTKAELGSVLAAPGPGATPLTLWHNAVVPYAVGSYRVDASGSGGTRRLLVESGRLKSRWSQARYAQYLKVEPSGELGNIEVEPGSYSEADLLKPESGRPLYHLFDFSYFEPNPVTGEFSAEIRAGEEITDSGTKPIKGGSVSGLSSRALAQARFSSRREQRERYFGPTLIRCAELTLAGE
jgi:predicted Zn-dependent protease